MGAAAYNRGNAAISRGIRAELRSPDFDVIDRLNSIPKAPGAPTPWGAIHFVPGHGGWWAECPITGRGYWYRTLNSALAEWNVVVTGVVMAPFHYVAEVP